MAKKLNHVQRLTIARASSLVADGFWIATVEHKPACRYVHRPMKCGCSPRIFCRNIDSGLVVEIGRNGELLGRGRMH